MAEAIGQFEDGQDELALGRASLLEPCLQSKMLNVGSIGCCRREVGHGRGCIWLAPPPVPGLSVSTSMASPLWATPSLPE
jgi:hypothetical protein